MEPRPAPRHVENDMPGELRAQFEAERQEHVVKLREKNSGLPLSYRTGLFSLDTYQPRTDAERFAVTACKEWIRGIGERPSLLLAGSVGIGKSHLAAASIAQCLGKHAARFVSAPDLIRSVQAVFSSGEVSEDEAVAAFAECPRLAIDDLDKVTPSPFVIRSLWTIVDARSRAELPTIYTANADSKGLYKRLAIEGLTTDAESIVDRIVGSCVRVRMDGASYRRVSA